MHHCAMLRRDLLLPSSPVLLLPSSPVWVVGISLVIHNVLMFVASLQAALVLLLDGLWFGYDQLQFLLR